MAEAEIPSFIRAVSHHLGWVAGAVAVVAWLLWSNFYLHTENKQTLHSPLLICLCTEFIGIVLEWYKKGNRIKKQIRFSRSPAIFKIFLSFTEKEELYSSGLSPLPSTERSAFLFIQKNSWKRHFQSFLKSWVFWEVLCHVMCDMLRVRREWRGRKPAADCGRYEDTRAGPHREMVERCGEYGQYSMESIVWRVWRWRVWRGRGQWWQQSSACSLLSPIIIS